MHAMTEWLTHKRRAAKLQIQQWPITLLAQPAELKSLEMFIERSGRTREFHNRKLLYRAVSSWTLLY